MEIKDGRNIVPESTDDYDVVIISKRLTQDQKDCICALSEEWTSEGYSKVTADILYATDSKFFADRFGPLVDCRYHQEPGISPNYHHRLLPLGVLVKAYLESTES